MSESQQRIALQIVEDLEREFPCMCKHGCDWDQDKAAEIIALLIPETAAEQEAEFARLLKDADDQKVGPPRPSRFATLRAAVHATDGMSITCVIEAAAATIEQLRAMLGENFKNCALTEANLAECRRLLREMCDAIDNAPKTPNPVLSRIGIEWHKAAIVQAARAAGGGNE
jgi:hypothetical protein